MKHMLTIIGCVVLAACSGGNAGDSTLPQFNTASVSVAPTTVDSNTPPSSLAIPSPIPVITGKLDVASANTVMTTAPATSGGNLPSAAAPLVPTGVGTEIHFITGNTADLDLMKAAGIAVVRMDFYWNLTEQSKGVYDWSAYDQLTANLLQRGMRPYYILDFSNLLYEPLTVATYNGFQYTTVPSPQTPAAVAAFAAWAAAAAVHFKSQNVIWEIWNEPNNFFWQPQPNVNQYITLAQATCTAIRNAVPSATVVAPAVNGFDWTFLYSFLASGILNCIDGVSIHPYTTDIPESNAAAYAYLRWLIAQDAPAAKASMPIISGEWGYATDTTYYKVSHQTQADYAVRAQLSNLLNGVPLSIWYDWKNDGTDPTNTEDNFGLVNADLSLKPAYTAMQTLTQQLSGFQLIGQLPMASSQDYALAFLNTAGKAKLAVWTTGSSHNVALSVPLTLTAPVTIVSELGTSTVEPLVNGALPQLNLTGSPQYISLN